MYSLKALSHLAPTAPSTVRWSLDSVAFMMLTSFQPFSVEASTSILGLVLPMARMHDCGGLMIAVKWSMPNMPRLEMVNEPPWYSSGLSLPSLARPASALVSAEIAARPLEPTSRMIGVMRPLGVATATQMSAFL